MNNTEYSIRIDVDLAGNSLTVDIPYKPVCLIRNYIKAEQKNKFMWAERINWNQATKLWETKIENYLTVLDLLHFLRRQTIPFTVSREANKIIQSLEAFDERAKWKGKDLPPEKVSGVYTELRGYQWTGVKFIDDALGKALIALGTGVGKTLIALTWCKWRKQKAIIVCPSQRGKTKRSWADEIRKHTSSKYQIIWGGTQADLVRLNQADFIIINYELLPKFMGVLKSLIGMGEFTTLIVDESHNIKNRRSLRYTSVKELADCCKHKILMSATPIKNKPYELFSQLNIVAPERFRDAEHFKSRYCVGMLMNKGGKIFRTKVSKSTLKKLNEDISGIYFYRDKLAILHELPELIVETIMYDTIPTLSELPKPEQHRKIAEYMMDNTVALVKEKLLEEDNSKIVVYTGFIDVAEQLASKIGKVCVLHHGSMTQAESDKAFKSFLDNPKIEVIVSTYQSLKESINLQHIANVMVFNDIPWTPSDIDQMLGRLHRMGQELKSLVFIQGFPETYSEEMFDIIERKASIMSEVLEGKVKDKEFLNRTIKGQGIKE